MKKTAFLLIALLSIISCRKKDSSLPDTNNNPAGQMSGKIVLPNGSPVDVGSCKVVARMGLSSVKNNTFTIDTTQNSLLAIFLTDQNDQPIMMRYLYPGQQDNDITAQSTALGLFMSLPSVQSLTDSAKLALLPKLSTTPEFAVLVDEMSKKLKSGGSFADGQDSTLNLALSKMFNKASTLRVSGLLDNPISIYSGGNKVSAVNNGTANIYGVGFYKDGQMIGNVQTLGGYDYLPTSLGDIIKHIYSFTTNSIIEEPKSLDYNLTNDGQYTLKIRSGGKIGDNSAEATLALRYDLLKGAMNIIALYVPEINTGQCKSAMIGKLLSYISNTYSISQLEASSSTAFAQFMLNSASYLFSTSSDLIIGCGSQKVQSAFANAVGKFLYYVNIVGAVNSAVNSSIIGYQLQNAKPIIDTCFKVTNGIVTSCNNIPNSCTSQDTLTMLTGTDSGPTGVHGIDWMVISHTHTINGILAYNCPSITYKKDTASFAFEYDSSATAQNLNVTYHISGYLDSTCTWVNMQPPSTKAVTCIQNGNITYYPGNKITSLSANRLTVTITIPPDVSTYTCVPYKKIKR